MISKIPGKWITTALVLFTFALVSCKATNNTAANDLAGAFQAGCSSTGTANTQIALDQTQSLINTIQDLRKKNQCQGLDQAQQTIGNMSSQIYALQQDPTSMSLNSLETVQTSLLAQINATTDPASLEILTTTYSSNALEIASLQGQEASLSGSPYTSNLQRGYSQLNSYINDLSSQTGDLTDCAQNNPDFAAKLGAQLMAVTGNFFTPIIGAAITLVGSVIEEVITVVDDSTYARSITDLNVSEMTTALSCSLESMNSNYCEAEDAMTLTKFAECAKDPASNPSCPKAPLASSQAHAVVAQFWQGLDVLSRSVPALQIWTAKVVSGVTPSDIYEAQKQNDLIASRASMDIIKRLAEGQEAQEKQIINSAALDGVAKRQEMVKGLKVLVRILSTGSAAASNSFTPSGSSPISSYYSDSQILYLLVGQPYNCQEENGSNPCKDVSSIPLPGDSGTTVLSNDGSGWDTITTNEGILFDSVYTQIETQLQAVDNADPSGVLEAVKISAGTGLPTPYEALNNISAFLQSSEDFYTNVSADFLDGGEAGRAKTLNLITSTKAMIDSVLTDVIVGSMVPSTDKTAPSGTLVPGTDSDTLASIYGTFQLGQDPNFISQRLTLHVQEDLGTRIKAGKIPKTASDILYANRTDPTDQLNVFSSDDQVEKAKASLATAITQSEMNTQNFVKFFSRSLTRTLTLLKTQADEHHEPMGGTPDEALYRSQLAKICILITSTQPSWPSKIDVKLCQGTFMQAESGEKISFDDLYAITNQPEDGSGKMCSIYRFYRKKP